MLAIVLVETWLATDEDEEETKAKKQAVINKAVEREGSYRPRKAANATKEGPVSIFKSN